MGASWRFRYGGQPVGKFRIGTSYRRNPNHLQKERDANKALWVHSLRDWRHTRGYRFGCSGCSACVRWEVLRRSAYRAWWRTRLQKELVDIDD